MINKKSNSNQHGNIDTDNTYDKNNFNCNNDYQNNNHIKTKER